MRSVASGRRLNSTSSTRSRQILRNVRIHTELAGIDDAHGHAGLDGMEQESGMDRFADRIVARNENEILETPPLMLTCGNRLRDRLRASM